MLRPNSKNIRIREFGFYFIIPALLLVSVLLIYPLISAFWISLNNLDLRIGLYDFVGLRNYINIFTKPELINSLKVTFIYSFAVISGTVIISFVIALLLDRDFFGKGFIRALLLIPWAVPQIAVALMWKYMFNPRFGIVNNILISLGLINKIENFLVVDWTAMLIIIIVGIYKWLPFTIFLFLASLQTIPKMLYEAATVDGVSPIGKIFKITLPLIRPAFVIIIILLTVSSLKAFDMIYILTGGGPGYDTSVINYMAYTQSFSLLKFGQGSALAFFISVIILTISIFYYKIFFKEVKYD